MDYKDDSNIVFVLHEGDITDGNTATEWTNAKVSISLLDGVVPYALAVGNHDGLWSSQSQTALFNQFFPLSWFQSLPTFGGVFESNRMDNCYHLFSAGGVDWLVLSLEFGPRDSVLAWANQVATNYPDRRVIVLTHAHVYPDNTLFGSSTNQTAVPTSYGRMNNGTDVWGKFLRHHANICAVFSGHLGFGRLVSVGDYGNPVFQMAADYQFDSLGGGGYLRIVQFFPDQDKMSVSTYSPYLDSWYTDSINQFTYPNLGVFTNASPGYLLDTQYASASLIITNDTVDSTPPGVTSLSYLGVPPVFKVTFTEPVEMVSAQTVTNYSIENGVRLTGAALLADGKTVALTEDSDLVPNALYTLTVTHVRDRSRANNEMTVPATNTFTYVPVFLSDDFTSGDLQGWTVVDEGTNDKPSLWREQAGHLKQLSNIYGPNANATDHRQGTFIYWNDPQALGWSNYSFSVTFNNSDDDGVGVMFRYQNPSNYYKVDLDSQRNFRKLFRMAGGVETTLAAESSGYVVGSNYVLHIEMANSEITVLLNDTVLFGGTITNSSLKTGTVALYSWGSQGVFFNDLKVTPLHRLPRVTIQGPADGAAFHQFDLIPIAVDASEPDGSIRKVNLFRGTSLLATLTSAPYLFQWTNLPLGSYTLTAQAVDDAGLVGVSSPVSLTITPPPPKPVLVDQPTNQNILIGNGIVFRVRADGLPPFGYQWLFNSAPIAGATNSFLVLNNAQVADAGTYAVVVTNQWGDTVSQPAVLSVDPATQPVGNTNDPPSLRIFSMEILDPGVPLVSVGADNVSVVNIEWSSNCLTWNLLLRLTNRSGVLYFADPAGTASQPRRFYRAVSQP